MISIVGPTASGKTRLAARLAYHIGSEVISADSRQVYRGMDIGTGKDLSDYQVEGHLVPYHLIDIVDAGDRYNLFQYQRDCHKALEDITRRNICNPILCGGTGLYVECILGGYNLPEAPENSTLRNELKGEALTSLLKRLAGYGSKHNNKDIDTTQRAIRAIEIEEYKLYQQAQGMPVSYPPVNSLIICLNLERDCRRQRISQRLHERLEQGMLQEIHSLLNSGLSPESLIYYGLEYKWLTLHAIGSIDYKTMVEQLEIAIHQFAKRQMTWFRGMERRGYKLNYIDALAQPHKQIQEILTLLKQ